VVGLLVVHEVHQVEYVLAEDLAGAGIHPTQLELLGNEAFLDELL